MPPRQQQRCGNTDQSSHGGVDNGKHGTCYLPVISYMDHQSTTEAQRKHTHSTHTQYAHAHTHTQYAHAHTHTQPRAAEQNQAH